MNKKTKLILGGLFIAAGIGLYIYNKNKDKDVAAAPICNDGEVPCPNNASVCYNPNARYNINPCDVVVGGEVTAPSDKNVDIPTGAEGGLPKNRR